MATRITASLSAGVTLEPRYYDMMNASQYRTYASEMLKTTNTTIRDFNFFGRFSFKLLCGEIQQKHRLERKGLPGGFHAELRYQCGRWR